MSIYDTIVIGVYLAFMLALGPIYKSFSKTVSDFFRGGGMLWWVGLILRFISKRSHPASPVGPQ